MGFFSCFPMTRRRRKDVQFAIKKDYEQALETGSRETSRSHSPPREEGGSQNHPRFSPPGDRRDPEEQRTYESYSISPRSTDYTSYGEALSRITEEPTLTQSASDARSFQKSVEQPPARVAAFQGPPRFDWIDVETNAAIKLQSIVRRNLVMDEMERKGLRTSAIRNRRRRRKAKFGQIYQTEDTPNFLHCCALGLAFGDATEEDDSAYRLFQKEKYEERQRQQAEHEEDLRRQYLRTHGAGGGKVVEAVEVVE